MGAAGGKGSSQQGMVSNTMGEIPGMFAGVGQSVNPAMPRPSNAPIFGTPSPQDLAQIAQQNNPIVKRGLASPYGGGT